MFPTQDTPELIASAFPGREALIDRAYRESGSFRDLCRDYRSCAQALERWRRMNGDKPLSRAREYVELLSQLGGEIGACLEAMESVSGPRRGLSVTRTHDS